MTTYVTATLITSKWRYLVSGCPENQQPGECKSTSQYWTSG